MVLVVTVILVVHGDTGTSVVMPDDEDTGDSVYSVMTTQRMVILINGKFNCYTDDKPTLYWQSNSINSMVNVVMVVSTSDSAE